MIVGKEVQRVVLSPFDVERVAAKLDECDLVLEPRDLPPAPVRPSQEVGIGSAVPVSDRGQDVAAIRAGLETRFRDGRQLLAQFASVLLRRCTQLVKVNLLVQTQLLGRPLARMRITRVE